MSEIVRGRAQIKNRIEFGLSPGWKLPGYAMSSLFSFPLLGLKGLAGQFLYALSLSHCVFVICAFQVVGGFFVILIRFVGLGFAVRATIIVNIQFFCFHVFTMPMGLPLLVAAISS